MPSGRIPVASDDRGGLVRLWRYEGRRFEGAWAIGAPHRVTSGAFEASADLTPVPIPRRGDQALTILALALLCVVCNSFDYEL